MILSEGENSPSYGKLRTNCSDVHCSSASNNYFLTKWLYFLVIFLISTSYFIKTKYIQTHSIQILYFFFILSFAWDKFQIKVHILFLLTPHKTSYEFITLN